MHVAYGAMPTFICHGTLPLVVKEAHKKGTALVEVTWPDAGTVSGSGDIKVYTLRGGVMVRTIHKGSCEACEPACLALFSWKELHHLLRRADSGGGPT
ncbi:MAG: hypothetical protein A4E40_00624 [Methanoregulaceae archaeon PtaU1.Bin059]|nr:MAG: hypothetical protein A4E39_00382 [Methanoregulaceae archaeon PtaB.Bin152]OPY41356.1 MAG: hypothetical protein A4E40_00624 [Methanoregulaceae archaeon PtaU1.Bin059]